MSGLKDIAKGGWHPKSKDGKSKESWRGDFKGINQVAGWVGKGKSPTAEALEHTSRPLSTLKDPAAFGPPPKNVNYHGGAALPNQITPDRRGLGAPLSEDVTRAKRREEEEEAQRQEEEEARSKPPSVPFRADTTGLSTAHLLPPPGRNDGVDSRNPAPSPPAKAKPPGPPPRLPPRQNSNPAPSPPPTYTTTSEPASHSGILNQSSLNRLSAAGVSVPGFGIGNKPKAPLPSLSPSSPSRSPVASHPTTDNNAQVNELQSRFSRLSSSTSPNPDGPRDGTTFAQKQAAFKTASSFRNDPSSVSLSDARSAASTANNFRERHGDEVKSGWQSANKLNNKYGIADKLNSYGGIETAQAVEPIGQGIELRDNTQGVDSGGQGSGMLGKKKPPPPPVKRAELTGGGVAKDGGPLPPPIPLSSKPKPQPSRSPKPQAQAQDLDLDLASLWFAKSHPSFPPPAINRLPGKRSYASSSSWSSSGVRKTYTFTGAIRDNGTLQTTIIHLTWDGSNPGLTVKAQQRHIPPPKKLTQSELAASQDRYSDVVASWSESKMGQQVGDGECWTLAHDALVAVGSMCSSRGQEPCMPSQSYVHGHLIYSYIPAVSPHPEPSGDVQDAGVVRGDILQLLTAHFKSKDGRSETWAGAPDHTAVITGVDPSGVLRVVEQNVGNVKKVQNGSYDMSELVTGEVRIFRAVGETWVGKLDPRW